MLSTTIRRRIWKRMQALVRTVFDDMVPPAWDHMLATVKVQDGRPVALFLHAQRADTDRGVGRLGVPEIRELVRLAAQSIGLPDLAFGEVQYAVDLRGDWTLLRVWVKVTVVEGGCLENQAEA